MAQLEKNHRKVEAMAKAQVVHDIAKLVKQQKTGEECEGQKSPSPELETNIEQGGVDS